MLNTRHQNFMIVLIHRHASQHHDYPRRNEPSCLKKSSTTLLNLLVSEALVLLVDTKIQVSSVLSSVQRSALGRRKAIAAMGSLQK